MDGARPWWLPLLLIIPAALAYTWGVLRLQRRGDQWPASRSVAAVAGFAVLTGALMPPLVDTMDFPVHIVQHLMLAMAAPLMFALSAPVTLALRTAPQPSRRILLVALHSRPARAFNTAPVVLVLELGGMYAYYLTGLFAATQRHPWLHLLVHTHMFLAGCLLSWFLVGRDPMPHRPSTRQAVMVLVLVAGSHDLLAKLMYAHLLPRGGGDPAQIQLGAQIMFYGGDAIETALAVALLAGWYARTGRELNRANQRRRHNRPEGGAGSAECQPGREPHQRPRCSPRGGDAYRRAVPARTTT